MRRNNTEILKLLIEKGANVTKCSSRRIEDYGDNPFVGSDEGFNPSQVAAVYGHVECLQMLLDAGAMNKPFNKYRSTPIQLAAWEGHAACVSLLMDRGSDPSCVNLIDNWNATMMAAYRGHAGALERLMHRRMMQNGQVVDFIDRADVLYVNKKCKNAMALAQSGGRTECVELLVKYQGDDPKLTTQYMSQVAVNAASVVLKIASK